MIISVEEAKREIANWNGWTDVKIERRLKAIEQAIRSYTRNNFQDRDCRRTADIIGGSFFVEALTPFTAGDTIQISESKLNKGLFMVTAAEDSYFTVKEPAKDEKDVLVTKVVYPEDVVECVFNLLDWDLKERDRAGIQSETLSRHSVTYFKTEDADFVMGYPKKLLGTLDLYKKARF